MDNLPRYLLQLGRGYLRGGFGGLCGGLRLGPMLAEVDPQWRGETMVFKKGAKGRPLFLLLLFCQLWT